MKNHRSTIYNNKNRFEPRLTTERTAGSSRKEVILKEFVKEFNVNLEEKAAGIKSYRKL